jgi:diguanylate cyclase (GGDEF)-like protein
MDSSTAFVAASLMMLANGAVLGLIHRDLPLALRPAAVSWQVGTLLIAMGCALYALPSHLPLVPLVTGANGLLMLGLSLYWQSLQRFFGLPTRRWQYLPALAATLGILWFSAVHPDTAIRVAISAAAWLVIMGGSVRVLIRGAPRDSSRSRQMLTAMFLGIMVLTALRAAYFVATRIPPDFSIMGNASWVNLASPLVSAALPVIGTTAFLLMCSEQIRRQWEHAASTDYLTDLPNRRTLNEIGGHRFEMARIRGEQVAIALIDIDTFKSINDCYGHEIGDLALKHVAASLRSAMEPDEVLARTGGEEFVALLAQTTPQQAQMAAEDLRRMVQLHPFLLRGVRIPLTVSVGIAVSHDDDPDFDSLLRRADQAMYAAKSGGRNRVELAA